MVDFKLSSVVYYSLIVLCSSSWFLKLHPCGLLQQEFFRKLMNLFRISEDLENLDSLHIIYKIVKGIRKYSLPT